MLSFLRTGRTDAPAPEGRDEPIRPAEDHRIFGRPLTGPAPKGMDVVIFGMGCFWGAERLFWQAPSVWLTAVGYAGGVTPNPTYDEVCTARTGHAEVVRVVHDPGELSFDELLRLFWEGHDPTQGNRQGNDVGPQYRSAIYWTTPDQRDAALASRDAYQAALTAAGRGTITTEIAEAGAFYHAETYHQQYLDRVPGGYCGLGSTGVPVPGM